MKLDSEISEKLVEGKILNDDKTVPPINYRFALTLGSDLSVDSNGKIAGNTIAGDLSAKLPEGSALKSLKYSTSNVVDIKGMGKPNKVGVSLHIHRVYAHIGMCMCIYTRTLCT